MREFKFEPIKVNSTAPGGACILHTFDDIGNFILNRVEVSCRLSPHWHAVRQDLAQARFGARREEVHVAMRNALATAGWLETS
jgi:phosphatidate phosphatase APP1